MTWTVKLTYVVVDMGGRSVMVLMMTWVIMVTCESCDQGDFCNVSLLFLLSILLSI